jgi:hypothetical protein
MREVLLPIGLASTIGSLPHIDVDEAVAFVLDRQPRLPAAPSLPRRAAAEGMIAQAAWGIAGVQVLPDGSLLVDEAAVDPDHPLTDGLDGEPFVGLRAFLEAITGRVAPFKVQLTGPVTLGLVLHAVGVSRDRAFAVAAKAVSARTRAVLQAARRAAPGATPLMFLDEPGLTAALEPDFPLDVDDTLDLVSSALAAIEERAIGGLHCCGRADWRSCSRPVPRCCRCRSTRGPSITPARSPTTWSGAAGWPGARSPPTARWARAPRSSGAAWWPSGTPWPRAAASPGCWWSGP